MQDRASNDARDRISDLSEPILIFIPYPRRWSMIYPSHDPRWLYQRIHQISNRLKTLILNNLNLTSFVPSQLVKHNEQQADEGCFFPLFPTPTPTLSKMICLWPLYLIYANTYILLARSQTTNTICNNNSTTSFLFNQAGESPWWVLDSSTGKKLIIVKLGQSYNHYVYRARHLLMFRLLWMGLMGTTRPRMGRLVSVI